MGELLRSLNGGGIVHGDGGTRDGGKDEDEGEDDNDDDDRERRLEEAYREFDGKVYSAWEAMRVDVGRQLREMGIPGFVLRAGLIGEGEGVELRRRVGGLLEDLCKD